MRCLSDQRTLTWHKHLVLVLLVRVCKDVGTLDGLRVESKDVVDDEQSTLCINWAGDIGLHAIKLGVAALGFISLGLDRRHGAAGVGLH